MPKTDLNEICGYQYFIHPGSSHFQIFKSAQLAPILRDQHIIRFPSLPSEIKYCDL